LYFHLGEVVATIFDWFKSLKTGNKEVLDLWIQIKPNINKMFENIIVLPSLLHGDLWSGNTGETDREPGLHHTHTFQSCNHLEFLQF